MRQRATTSDAHSNESDHILKFNLTYNIDDKKMIYFTRSEGYRPGGSNRVPNAIGVCLRSGLRDQLRSRAGRRRWLDDRLRVNGAIYLLDWDNFQYGVYDLSVSILTTTTNVGKSQSKGAELEVTYVPIDKLTLSLSAAYTDAKLQQDYYELATDTRAQGRAGHAHALRAGAPGELHRALWLTICMGLDVVFAGRAQLYRRQLQPLETCHAGEAGSLHDR